MFAEALVRSGLKLVKKYPPEGRAYWSARFWDRDEVESHPALGSDFQAQKDRIDELLIKYGADCQRVLEFACGTGEFTVMAARRTGAAEIVATDISQHALDIAATRVTGDRVRFVRGDFWADSGLGTADFVMCVDAIHHLGEVRAVLERLRTFIRPGGVLVGNLWTLDNFHEYQRARYGHLRHFARSLLFFGTAVTMRATGGRIRTASYRTQLLRSRDVGPLLREVFSQVEELQATRHFVCFACRS